VPHPPLALAYHGVGSASLAADHQRALVASELLERHVERLRAWGYELLSFSAWAERTAAGDGAGRAALTFDDGFADNLTTLVPLLHRLQAPATTFVITGWLGRQHPHTPSARVLSAREVEELHAAGVEIGAHTRTHPELPGMAPGLVRDELAGSKADLEDLLGVSVTTLSYPYGSADAETIAIAGEVGFTHACRALGLGGHADPLDLQRQDMGNHSSMLGLRLKRDDRYMPAMRHRSVRVVRRARLTCLGAPLRRPAAERADVEPA
jgi:peptidoglycan/xylan/chitin deacetylase (PgdA/CDA1 family)